jgi:hypothetical protein
VEFNVQIEIECNGVLIPQTPITEQWTHGKSLIVSKQIEISVEGVESGCSLCITISRESTGWNRAPNGIRKYSFELDLPNEYETIRPGVTDIRYWPDLDDYQSREITCGYPRCLSFDPSESNNTKPLPVKGLGSMGADFKWEVVVILVI